MTDSPEIEAPLSVGAILRRTLDLLRRSSLRVLIALTLLVAPGIVIDLGLVGPDGQNGLTLLNSLLSLALQFWLTKAVLDELGFSPSGGLSFPAFFGLVLLSGIGILLGLILFVVPGVILFVRWSISAPILLGSEVGVVDSMHESWRQTEGRFWPILGTFVAIYVPALVLAVAGFFLQDSLGTAVIGVVLVNVALQAGIVAGWHAAVAIFSLVSGPDALSKVFD